MSASDPARIKEIPSPATVCPKCGASGGEYPTCTVCGTAKVLATPLVGADPPEPSQDQIDTACLFLQSLIRYDDISIPMGDVYAVLAFAARQPRPITPAMVKAAAWAAHLQFHQDNYGKESGTAMLVAKETWEGCRRRREHEALAALEAAEAIRSS